MAQYFFVFLRLLVSSLTAIKLAQVSGSHIYKQSSYNRCMLPITLHILVAARITDLTNTSLIPRASDSREGCDYDKHRQKSTESMQP